MHVWDVVVPEMARVGKTKKRLDVLNVFTATTSKSSNHVMCTVPDARDTSRDTLGR